MNNDIKELNNGTKTLEFDIFGSCVSRDLFEIKEAVDLQCKEYIARQSIVSALAKPIEIADNEVINLNSNFQKQSLLNDFQKTTFQKLEKSNSNYLLIDFIDERFKLVKLGRYFVTYSSELVISKYLENKKYKLFDKRRWIKKKLYKQIKLFAERIKDIYQEDHIIIHKVKLLDEYISKDNVKKQFAKKYIIR